MPAKLVLMRHGQSLWNLENRFTGFKDVPLTQAGEEEAIAGGEKMEEAGMIDDEGETIFGPNVFTSTLERAIYTTELALNHRRSEFTMHDDLRERDYGDLTGLNKAETAKQYGEEQVKIWRRSYDVPPPGGESLKDVVNRHRSIAALQHRREPLSELMVLLDDLFFFRECGRACCRCGRFYCGQSPRKLVAAHCCKARAEAGNGGARTSEARLG